MFKWTMNFIYCRLTIQTDGDTSCYEVETCIEPVQSSGDSDAPTHTGSGQRAQPSLNGIAIPKAAATQPDKVSTSTIKQPPSLNQM